MISIITAIHNNLNFSRLFYESLRENTKNPFELIIVDNNSTDESYDYFKLRATEIVRNNRNLCYPCSQNQGLEVAKYKYVSFLNNDIVLSKNWDEYLISTLEEYNLSAVSPIGIENMGDPAVTKSFSRKWNLIQNITMIRILQGLGIKLSLSHIKMAFKLMYGDWTKFNQRINNRLDKKIINGIAGNCILTSKKTINQIGVFDKRVLSGDWDFFIRLAERRGKYNDVT